MNFTGTLNANIIYAAMFNMIISQEVFADNLQKHQTLVDKAKVDGSLYGDQKLYYSTDVLKTRAWLNDSEASNLLNVNRAKAPEVQSLVMNVFRQIDLTTDNYLTKQAWEGESSFANFTSVMLGWIRDTRRVYDGTRYNVYIGTTETSARAQIQSVDITTAVGSATGEEKNRLQATAFAEFLANLIVEMGDYSRDFNDYGHMRSHDEGNIRVIWNSKFLNKLKYLDLPTIFHDDSLKNKFDSDVLPARYWGTPITSSNVASFSASTPAAGKPIDSDDSSYVPGSNHANGCIRSLLEVDVTVSTVAYHLFPGDEIPAGATIKAGGDFELGTVYIEQGDIIAKVVTVLPPYMSAFSVETSFFNPRSLTENHYLTFGTNTLEYLKGKPFVTIKAI